MSPAGGSGTTTTYYVRDAQGNVLGVYSDKPGEGLAWQEQHLYGSSRLGMVNPNFKIAQGQTLGSEAYQSAGDPLDNGIVGLRRYELTNHLGNVLSTISDRSIGVDEGNNGVVDYHKAEVLSAQDYYPFGMQMPGRSVSNGSGYRYSINGQEKEKELNENITSADFWMYDSRIGKRWNIDPITKPYASPYATFGGNPICNIDPDGADTINITRTTTTIKAKGLSDGHSDNLVTPSRNLTSVSGQIDIKAAKGLDVFRVTDVNITIDEDGNENRTSNTTTLDIRGENSGYRNGGHNISGFADDRYALASMAPTWLLNQYANKNKGFDTPTEWGLGAAKAYQKDVPFVVALQKVSNAAYVITGAYGIVRMTLTAAVPAVVEEGGFFTGTRYTSKVFKQMNSDYYHGFPESVKAFENYGIRSTIVGGDGVKREMLRIPGLYGNKGGFFEFIKEADGSINHRVFMPIK